MTQASIGVVMNPIAGGGRMAAVWPAIGAILEKQLGRFDLARTSRPGDATTLAQRFAEDGKALVIAAGGDGTAGEVADGILRVRRDVQLGLLPVGTGRDFARSIDIRRHDHGVDALLSGKTRAIDAGLVRYVDREGRASSRHFLNIASLGLSGQVAQVVNGLNVGGRPAGKVTFMVHSIAQLLRYRPTVVRVRIDGAEVIEEPVVFVAVANGRYFGGGMQVAPDAVLDDGLFDVIIVKARSKPELLWHFPKIYAGSHTALDIVTVRRAKRVEVTPAGRAPELDVDGESQGVLPATFEVLPGALTIRG